MEIINFAKNNSLVGQFLREMRDVNTQGNRLLFRNNIHRIGQVLAYEISKTLDYKPVEVTTPLTTMTDYDIADQVVVGTILRAGLPLHEGILSYFDKAENAFVSAFRKYREDDHNEFDVVVEYNAAPSIEGKVLILADPMLATGMSMELAYQALLSHGTPKHIHIASIIASEQGVEYIKNHFPADKTTVWIGAVDPILNEHKYIVPGLGDCGDLAYGDKL